MVKSVTATTSVVEAVDKNTKVGVTLDELRRAVPEHCFDRSITKSLMFAAWDICWFLFCFFGLFEVVKAAWAVSFVWSCVIYPLYCLCTGYTMWILFVLGHECTHDSFSPYLFLNEFCGNLIHGLLCVPFAAWRISHISHHSNHQNMEKDKSFPWWEKETEKKESPLHKVYRNSGATPFLAWPLYIYAGFSDGSHLVPFFGMFKNHPRVINCLISSAFVGAFFYLYLFVVCEGSFTMFALRYGAPFLIFSFWLFTVTFLQHHLNDGETKVYRNNKSWSYLKGALETVDRQYGAFVDVTTHHITDGHIAHHLFPKIPHYHLKEATKAIYQVLDDKKVKYHCINTPYFWYDSIRETIVTHFYVTNIVE